MTEITSSKKYDSKVDNYGLSVNTQNSAVATEQIVAVKGERGDTPERVNGMSGMTAPSRIIKSTNGYRIRVDACLYDELSQFGWHVRLDERWGNRYVNSSIKGKSVLMHRLIMNAPRDRFVDHINHNGLDNRRVNLRLVTISQNGMNRRRQKNNTSGYAGVHYSENRWKAEIRANKNFISLGSFSTRKEAIRARTDGERKYFGEYAYKGVSH